MAVSWREVQRQNFKESESFLEFVALDLPSTKRSAFPLNVPRRLAQKIKKGDPNDPIFLQFFPSLKEEEKSPLFVLDPVHDENSQKSGKLLHKYQGRALLLCTSACAMHCRYCFRQHFDYETAIKSFDEELTCIQEDSSLQEIILSGGDPLSLSNRALQDLLQRLDAISHVKRIRFHTRFLMGIPERIEAEFLDILKKLRCQVVFVIHSNHAQEWDEDIFYALKEVQKLAIPVLCQTVLLKGVNDSVEALHDLFSLLANHGILPYYLHQLDRVEGASHFEVEEKEGLAIMQQLAKTLSGYALPRYVREIGGEPHKVVITSGPKS